MAAAALAGERVRLTRDAAKDEIHEATKASAWDGSGVVPNRRRSQKTRLHRRCQSGDGESFPLHVKDRAKAWNCEVEGEVQGSASGAEGNGREVAGAGI